jgi:hypothetical protein
MLDPENRKLNEANGAIAERQFFAICGKNESLRTFGEIGNN